MMVSPSHRAFDSAAAVHGRHRISGLRRNPNIISAGLFAFLLALGISFPALALCPEAAQIETKLESLTQRSSEVLTVRPSALPGHCEVVARSDSKAGIFYTDESGTRFFFGNLIDAVTGINLTEEALSDYTEKGISSTPTYIFNDGRFHSGLLKMPDLQRWLRTERPADKAPAPDQKVFKNTPLQPMPPNE